VPHSSVEAHENRNFDVIFEFPEQLKYGTMEHSELIKIRYELKLVVQVSQAFNLETILPLHLLLRISKNVHLSDCVDPEPNSNGPEITVPAASTSLDGKRSGSKVSLKPSSSSIKSNNSQSHIPAQNGTQQPQNPTPALQSQANDKMDSKKAEKEETPSGLGSFNKKLGHKQTNSVAPSASANNTSSSSSSSPGKPPLFGFMKKEPKEDEIVFNTEHNTSFTLMTEETGSLVSADFVNKKVETLFDDESDQKSDSLGNKSGSLKELNANGDPVDGDDVEYESVDI